MLRLFRSPGPGDSFIQKVRHYGGFDPGEIEVEYCFYIETTSPLDERKLSILKKYLATTYNPYGIGSNSFLSNPTIVEIGPRMTFQTMPSSTTVSIFQECGLTEMVRIERSVRMGFQTKLEEDEIQHFLAPLFKHMVFDKMTQERYYQPLTTFDTGVVPEPVQHILIIEQGISALKIACDNDHLGLSLDHQDLEYAYSLFRNRLKRNPTDVELFLFGQQWSEHCGHGYWKGLRKIDGVASAMTLMEYAKEPWRVNPGNSLVGFGDEASVFKGLRPVMVLVPENPGESSNFITKLIMLNPANAAESHCHPSKGCPREGAATGIARVRDNITVGIGAEMGIGLYGMAVGNPCIPGFVQPWEEMGWEPIGAVSPLEIALEARRGAFGFANALGESCPGGWFISFGLDPGDGYRSYPKPIIYTFGHSLIRDEHLYKKELTDEMVLVQWGGLDYPIGVGGGSRSSTSANLDDDTDKTEKLDFDSVQRGAPEMQQRGVRVVRGCIELGFYNPLEYTKDLGAGGDITAIPEIFEKFGGRVELRQIPCGAAGMRTYVLLGSEAQERHVGAVKRKNLPVFQKIADRERCPWAVLGEFTGDGHLIIHDENDNTNPVDLPMDAIFATKPQKVFELETVMPKRSPLKLPKNLNMETVLKRVLSHPTVSCKGWLTSHVDRSVGARNAQQSCLGPWHLPLSDYSIMATSFLDKIGTAFGIGVQPHIGLISAAAMARVTLSEALLNLSGAKISSMTDICCEVNWFAAAKERGEGVVIDEAARNLAEAEIEITMRQLGGKDSSALKNLMINPRGEKVDVKSPVTLVIAISAQMHDINKKVTPLINGDTLIHVDLLPNCKPIGATILSQVYKQTGNDCADVNIGQLIKYFNTTQGLIDDKLISSLHDISDGGLATTLSEMSFVSGIGLELETKSKFGWLKYYFSQVPGVVIVCKKKDTQKVLKHYELAGVTAEVIGSTSKNRLSPQINIKHNSRQILSCSMTNLRQVWLETSFQFDQVDTNPVCIDQERQAMANLLTLPPYKLTYTPERTAKEIQHKDKIYAAVLRAPGSNGDRDLAGMAYAGGFTPLEVMTSDFFDGKNVGLEKCQIGLMAGGFSYMDEPLEAGVGWAASIMENQFAWEQYRNFYFDREDTLSYHPCNGAQTALIMGIVPSQTLEIERRPRFLGNDSGMFESRFSAVKIMPSPAIMFNGMADSILGIIVAHGEGKLYCPGQDVIDWILKYNLAPMRYVDMSGNCTKEYPFNPNGSVYGVAGLCTPDGRHVVTMPHIERLFEKWHWPWMPKSWQKYKASPWLKPIQNMFDWCQKST